MTINQISIFLENKYGKLSEILELLAGANIRIIATTVADTSEYGILRIIVSDTQKAFSILKEHNVSANLTEVLAIVTNSSAGSFAHTLACLPIRLPASPKPGSVLNICIASRLSTRPSWSCARTTRKAPAR